MSDNQRVTLPSNLEKFLRSGTGQSYDRDETMTDLLYAKGKLAGGEQYLAESASRMVSTCLDLEVRLAGARLLEAAQHIELGNAAQARESLSLATALLDGAFARAEKERLLLTVRRQDSVEAIAVIAQQLDALDKR